MGYMLELIAPVFKVIGFSLFKVTFLFSLLEALSYLALAAVFLKLTQSFLIRLFWLFSSAILFGFAFQKLSKLHFV